jgi:arsenite methyltransferase
VKKLRSIGFEAVERGEERAVAIDDCAQYPVFTPELLGLMRQYVPPERQYRVARSVVFIARKPSGA